VRISLIADLNALPCKYPGAITSVSKETVWLMGCGGFVQFCVTLRGIIDPERFCPFCRNERARRQRVFTKTWGDWGLLANEFPRKDIGHMWLIIPQRHVTDLEHLDTLDWLAIGKLIQHYNVHIAQGKGGGIMARFGDPHYNAGSVPHFHMNIIEPIPGTEFRAPLAKNEPDHAKNYTRLMEHVAEMQKRGGRDWLFSPEGIKETQP
jgi:diadenosine tetraphosphate (Ap4A) HIT family hydrolase